MNVTFSVNRQSPAGPRVECRAGYGPFSQSAFLTVEAARDVYRRLGDAILAAETRSDIPRPATAAENRSPGSLEGAA